MSMPVRPPAPSGAGSLPATPPRVIARWNDNELIFFDHDRRENWIVYLPRTGDSFGRWVVAGGALDERRRWSAAGIVEEHVFTAAAGCAAHGLNCTGQPAIQAAIDSEFNPFT